MKKFGSNFFEKFESRQRELLRRNCMINQRDIIFDDKKTKLSYELYTNKQILINILLLK